MMKPSDRRSAPRVSLDAAAVIRLESVGSDIRSRIINVSRNGVLLAMPEPREVGTRFHVTVQIEQPPCEIRVSGIVVHVTQDASAPVGFATRVGIFLTETGPDWLALCARLLAASGQ